MQMTQYNEEVNKLRDTILAGKGPAWNASTEAQWLALLIDSFGREIITLSGGKLSNRGMPRIQMEH